MCCLNYSEHDPSVLWISVWWNIVKINSKRKKITIIKIAWIKERKIKNKGNELIRCYSKTQKNNK